MIEAACAATRRFGIHSATSRSGFGNNPATLAAERGAAEFFGTEDAFYFSSGYVGNHILIQAIADRCDFVLADESSHFCLFEAAKLLGRPTATFRHRDSDDLRQQLRQNAAMGRRPLVLTDGVFALSGRLAPLPDYVEALAEYPAATLLVDDAHGFGTLGDRGRGTLEHFDLWEPAVNAEVGAAGLAILVSGTLSKALGGYGGILPGSDQFLDRVRRSSHHFAGASAPMAAAAGTSATALAIVIREPELRAKLRERRAVALRLACDRLGGGRIAGADCRADHRRFRENASHSCRAASGGNPRSLFRLVCRFEPRGNVADRPVCHAYRYDDRSAARRIATSRIASTHSLPQRTKSAQAAARRSLCSALRRASHRLCDPFDPRRDRNAPVIGA